MDFIPELIDEAVVVNGADICNVGSDCRPCSELSVGVHNWMVANSLNYLIVDFQDEKDVCVNILTELIQLQKRLRFPFLFCGMMAGPKEFLKSYAYSGHPFFSIPEEAVDYLRTLDPSLLMRDLSGVRFGEPIPCTRSRNYRPEEAGVEADQEDEEQEAEGDI